MAGSFVDDKLPVQTKAEKKRGEGRGGEGRRGEQMVGSMGLLWLLISYPPEKALFPSMARHFTMSS